MKHRALKKHTACEPLLWLRRYVGVHSPHQISRLISSDNVKKM